MMEYLGFLILGTGAGAIIAAMSLSLLITQQGAATVNLSLGATMTWTAHLYADLRDGFYTLPFPVLPDRIDLGGDVGLATALVLSLGTAALMAVLLFRLVFRPLYDAPTLSTIVAGIGIIIMFTALVELRFADAAGIRVDSILPNDPVSVPGGLGMPSDGLWLAAIVVVVAIGLWALSRYSRVGLMVRAASQNEKGLSLLGLSAKRIAEASYVFSTLLASLVGILAAPMLQLTSVTYTFTFLIPALGAAVMARFRSIGLALFVAFAIGMIQSTFIKAQIDLAWWPRSGAREGFPFLVIIVAMWLRGDSLPDRGAVSSWRLSRVPQAKVTPLSIGIPIAAALVGLYLLGPLWRTATISTTIAIVFALSFVVLTGFAGQTSLAQMAIAGMAGFSLSRIATDLGVPFPAAPLLAALIATAAGVLVGFPALRVRGTNLAIVTLGGSVAITEFFFKNPDFIGGLDSGGARVPNPSIGSFDFGLVLGDESSRPIFGVFLVIVAALLALAVANLRRGAIGRRLLAVRGNERAALASGISVFKVKLAAYAISSFIAGIGGCLIAYRFGRVSDASFGVVASLAALAVAYLGGISSVSGAVTAGLVAASGVAFFGLTELLPSFGAWETFIGGFFLVLTAVLNPEGIAGGIQQEVAHKRARRLEHAQAGAAAT